MSEQRPGGTAAGGDRCPSCGARVAVSQDWCTLCHARLDGGEVPSDSTGATDATAATDSTDATDAWAPATLPPATLPPSTLPPGAAEAMLAELAASTAGERTFARGPLAGRSRAVRMALALGAGLVLALLGVGLLSLIGLLL